MSIRSAEIEALIIDAGSMSIDELAGHFGVSPQTIRRDVNRLCEAGLLRRIHGGVEIQTRSTNLAYHSRRILNAAEKRKVAAAVADEIPDGVTLAFSIGTTPECVMQALLGHRDLRVITNNINVALAATRNETFEVTIAGGRLRHGDHDVLGAGAEDFFARYKVDYGIFGVAGIDESGALLDFEEDEVGARRAIRENSRQSFLVLDHSKFGRPAHVRGGHVRDVTKVFCDMPAPAALMDVMDEADVGFVVCGGTE